MILTKLKKPDIKVANLPNCNDSRILAVSWDGVWEGDFQGVSNILILDLYGGYLNLPIW